MPKTLTEWFERVRVLNDLARRDLIDCHLIVASGIAALPAKDREAILARVRGYDDFTSENDPDGVHNFGAFDYGGRRIWWRINHYDRTGERGSVDPADPAVAKRVLTVLLADEI